MTVAITTCRYCGQRIIQAHDGIEWYWFHVETAMIRCGQHDRAEPRQR